MEFHPSTLQRRIFLVVLSAAFAWALIALAVRVWVEMQGVLVGDAIIYQTVGRGILNGLKPYQDLFETKPPGVFLLHALSWKIFGSQFLVKLAQVLALLGIPLCIALPAFTQTKGDSRELRLISLVLALLLGTLLALYTADQAGFGVAESYSAFFGLCFVAIVAVQKERIDWKLSFLLGALLLGAIGFKEPFFFSILGASLLVIRNPRSLIRGFLFPCVIAGILGVLILFLLGFLQPFFGIYLAHMLGFHIYQNDFSLWVRMFWVSRTWGNLATYSIFFAAAIMFLWLMPLVTECMRGRFSFVIRWSAATLLTLLAIASSGDFYGHHFIFAVPVYGALFFVGLRQQKERIILPVLLLFTGLLALTSFSATQFRYDLTAWRTQDSTDRHAAAAIDHVMDQCGYGTFVSLINKGGGPFAYTKISPAGPIFTQYSRFIGGSRFYQERFLTAFEQTPLLLLRSMEETNLSEFSLNYLREYFTMEAPPCAEPFTQPAPYSLLFRKG